ncbi:hypothetical protein [Mycobacterium montefiorense]|uniref:hypothetical protein n=1 Tax=Mycobacterium montefiorense TaxID=154654 RepID=UPI0021F343CD|nr:hypothetical protein [Mycobacterium montefiorense]MCV7428069.1 hypothetical protein [Mycobacterium montefiorense]
MTVVSVFALWAGSQIAHDRGQTVEWYAGFGQWLGGLGSLVAAGVALSIATGDRRERQRERDDANHAQARLVQIEVARARGTSNFQVKIRNYGDRAIIGAGVTDAWWFGQPDYGWRHSDIDRDPVKIVQPYVEGVSKPRVISIQFTDAYGERVPKRVEDDEVYSPTFEEVPVMPDAVVVFLDANGNYWETGSSIPAKRISRSEAEGRLWRAP